MTRYHNINGERIAFTSQEETSRDAEEKTAAEEKAANSYKFSREDAYPNIPTQLDQLYHDMKDGKLGVAATTGSWFVGISSVKTAIAKT